MSVDKRWQLRVEHVLEAIEKIQMYTAGLTEETFAAQGVSTSGLHAKILDGYRQAS